MTDYYTCADCQGYVLTCGCLEADQAATLAKRQRREASKRCSWYAVTTHGRSRIHNASHEAEALRIAQASFGKRLRRIVKVSQETIWSHDDP